MLKGQAKPVTDVEGEGGRARVLGQTCGERVEKGECGECDWRASQTTDRFYVT